MIAGFVVGAILSCAVIMIIYDALWRRKRLESDFKTSYNYHEVMRDAGIFVIEEKGGFTPRLRTRSVLT